MLPKFGIPEEYKKMLDDCHASMEEMPETLARIETLLENILKALVTQNTILSNTRR